MKGESIGPSSLNAQFQKFLKFLRKPFKSDHYSEGSEEAAAAPAHFHDALLRTIVSFPFLSLDLASCEATKPLDRATSSSSDNAGNGMQGCTSLEHAMTEHRGAEQILLVL